MPFGPVSGPSRNVPNLRRDPWDTSSSDLWSDEESELLPVQEPDEDEDPFDDGLEGQDDEGDAKIRGYLRTATGPGRETATALSALAQQMQAYRPLSAQDQSDKLAEYNAGLEATARLASKGRLSPAQREKLIKQVNQGERAQSELVGSMFRLVMVISRELATERFGKERSLSMLEDLVSEANVALVEALPRYDPARCPTFAVCAGRVIRDRVRASLTIGSALQVPSAWLRVKRIAATRVPELVMELGRTPTLEEIQEALLVRCMAWAYDHLTPEQQKLDADEREELMRAKLRKQGMLGGIERYEDVMRYTQATTSLDAPVGDEGGSTYGDFLAEPTGDEVFDAVEMDALRTDVANALAALNERERDIILHRFGWVDGESWTYAKLAPRYGVSAERVRQIEASVLSKLRGPAFSRLAGYLPGHEDEPPAPPVRRDAGSNPHSSAHVSPQQPRGP